MKDPEKSIVGQIVKTVCLIGVVEKYKVIQKKGIFGFLRKNAVQPWLFGIFSQSNCWIWMKLCENVPGLRVYILNGGDWISRSLSYSFSLRQKLCSLGNSYPLCVVITLEFAFNLRFLRSQLAVNILRACLGWFHFPDIG